MPAMGDNRRIGQRGPLLCAHGFRGVALRRLSRSYSASVSAWPSTAAFVAARSPSSVMCLARCLSRSRSENVVAPRQRRHHLLRITRRRLIGPSDDLGPFNDLGSGLAHPHRADVLLRMRRGLVGPNPQLVLDEVAVLMVAPLLAPDLSVRHHGTPAGKPHLGIGGRR
jgi:hypothetical protein